MAGQPDARQARQRLQRASAMKSGVEPERGMLTDLS
jgi:hypothetical protein